MQGIRRASTIVQTAPQQLSVMSTLNQISPNRTTSVQILSKMQSVSANYHEPTRLNEVADSIKHGGYIKALVGRIMEEFHPEDETDHLSLEITGSTATNFKRMNFFHQAGDFGLQIFFNGQDEDSKRKRALTIEALLAAIYFGSGLAGHWLLEQNKLGVITLTAAEIQHIVQARIYYYERAFGTYNVQTGQHDDTGIDAQLQATQFLPELLSDKAAWEAVRLTVGQEPDLYQKVLRVAYLASGAETQKLIQANETLPYIALSLEEIRFLVSNQIARYRAFSRTHSVAQAIEHAPIHLLQQAKVWAALEGNASESYEILFEFFRLLTSHLPNAANVMTPAALAHTTEMNPLVFKGYFEDRAAHVAIAESEISEEDRPFIKMRNDVLQAMFRLRHLVAKPDIDALYDMRPLIAAKIQSNAIAKQVDATAIIAEAGRLAALDAADLAENPNPTETVRYKGEGKTGLGSTFSNSLDTTIGKWTSDSRTTFDEKLGKARQKNKAADIARYEARLVTAQASYDSHLVRKQERNAALELFKEGKAQAAAIKAQELQALITHEEALRDAFAIRNPFSKAIELVLLVVAQDFAVYKTLTNQSKRMIALLILGDIKAYLKDGFAYKLEGRAEQRLPLVVAVNAPAYLVFLKVAAQVFFKVTKATMLAAESMELRPELEIEACIQEFWVALQDQLFDAAGLVNQVNIVDLVMQKPFHFLSRKDIRDQNAPVEEINTLVTRYRSPGYQDSLSALLNGSKLLALFISVHGHIFSAPNAAYTDVMRDTDATRARLSKIIARPYQDAPSRLTNYLQMALVAMLDKPAIGRLLLEDIHNPFYSILHDKGRVQSMTDFIMGMTNFVNKRRLSVIAAISPLADTQEQRITMADTNNAYYLLAYLKSKLDECGVETEIDFLVRECLCYMIHSKYMQYCTENGAAKVADDIIAGEYTRAATERRKIRGEAVKTLTGIERQPSVGVNRRTSTSIVEITSPVQEPSISVMPVTSNTSFFGLPNAIEIGEDFFDRTISPPVRISRGHSMISTSVSPTALLSTPEVVVPVEARISPVESVILAGVGLSTPPKASAIIIEETLVKKPSPPPPPPPRPSVFICILRRDSSSASSANLYEIKELMHKPVGEEYVWVESAVKGTNGFAEKMQTAEQELERLLTLSPVAAPPVLNTPSFLGGGGVQRAQTAPTLAFLSDIEKMRESEQPTSSRPISMIIKGNKAAAIAIRRASETQSNNPVNKILALREKFTGKESDSDSDSDPGAWDDVKVDSHQSLGSSRLTVYGASSAPVAASSRTSSPTNSK